jgi:nucleotide-binding universal stress UspA family protein
MNAQTPILAATDFSAPARHAADRAARLARVSAAPLTLMHVLPAGALQGLRQWLGADSDTELQLQTQALRQLQQQALELQAARHVPVATRHASGPPVEALVREAEAMDASLLVLGARGEGFLRRWVMGSTAERLLHRSQRPLLVVRQAPRGPYRRVLLALDFSPWSLRAVALAQQVAPHAHLVLLHAFQVPFAEKLQFAGVDAATIEHYRTHARAEASQLVQAMAQTARLSEGQWEPRIVEGDAAQRIVELEQELGCDLVVLGKHGQSAAEDLLLGSVTQHVLAQGSTDVLVSTRQAPR